MTIKDGDWELKSYDHVTGRSVWSYFDGQATHFRTDYPVENILKNNQIARTELSDDNWGNGRRVASIPLNVYFDQLKEAQDQQDNTYLSKWLNDSDNAAFRTREGRV